jgi:protein-tyrosine phosphatase
MTPHLYWISGPWKGRLAISARPRGADWLEDEVSGWRRAGVDSVVSLLESSEDAQLQLERESEFAERHGLTFVSFPIPDRGVPAVNSKAAALLSQIKTELAAGQNVAVHCRQGIGRSGLIAAGVLIVSGLPVDDAVHAVSSARGLPIPETRAQSDWLQRLESNRVALAS